MGRWRRATALSLAGIVLVGSYQYEQSHTFRSVCNLGYAGLQMTRIYKLGGDQPIEIKNRAASEYLRDSLRKNGGIYLKLGQLIATLDVIVPDEYREVMNTLTRQCKVSPYDRVKDIVESELGYPIQVVFKEFDREPISSASIAQVHRAVLLNGQEVAVKVQHGDLARQVEGDLALMHRFVWAAKRLFKQFHYEWLVQEFDKNIRNELDFVKEAGNIKRVGRFLQENKFKDIYVPKVLLPPTSRLLVMEYINGVHLDQREKLGSLGLNSKKLGQLFSKMIVKMIHKEGYVHADPHSGNLMARKYKGRDQLVLLDHGLYQQLDPALLKSYNQFWLGLILNDPSRYTDAARRLGTQNPQLLCSILTSKTSEELSSGGRYLFDLNPSTDKAKIMSEAAKNHNKIIKVLSELRREVLLLLKVNEFARTIENMMGGRPTGVYEDIARECIQNAGLSMWRRWGCYLAIWKAHRG